MSIDSYATMSFGGCAYCSQTLSNGKVSVDRPLSTNDFVWLKEGNLQTVQLQCGCLFHNSCLHKWLSQYTSYLKRPEAKLHGCPQCFKNNKCEIKIYDPVEAREAAQNAKNFNGTGVDQRAVLMLALLMNAVVGEKFVINEVFGKKKD